MTDPTLTKPLRTLIVDDEPLAIERMQVICGDLAGIEVVGTAQDGTAALRVHVHALRRAIDEAPARPLLRTMPGIGYAIAPDAD